MRTYEQLEQLWSEAARSPRDRGTVELIVIRVAEGEREVPQAAEVSPEHGLHGDRWIRGKSPNPERQITLMNTRAATLIADGQSLDLFGDNFLVDLDLGDQALPAGTRLRMGTCLLEVSAVPHTGCKKFRERFGLDALHWVNADERSAEKLRGINCRVLEAGTVRVGDTIEIVPG